MNIKGIMKHGLACLLIAFLFVAVSCGDEDRTYYEGPNMVQFSDTSVAIAIDSEGATQEVLIAASEAVDYDRNFGVEVLGDEGHAIEGYHYDILDNTVTIKAGERVGAVNVIGYHDNLVEADSLDFRLKLINMYDEYNLGSQECNVFLKKVCPFDINVFIGPYYLSSEFLYTYTGTRNRVVDIVADTLVDNGLIIKDCLQDGYDLHIVMTDDNPLEPVITYDDQILGISSDFLGSILGDNKMRGLEPSSYSSGYNVCEDYLGIYITLYIEDVGSFGTSVLSFDSLTEAEADYLRSLGY